jgi:hypothetical protein
MENCSSEILENFSYEILFLPRKEYFKVIPLCTVSLITFLLDSCAIPDRTVNVGTTDL